MIRNKCTDIAYLSINHDKEQLCGDHVETVDLQDDSHVLVLADGLGSGVKANILSILTSQMLSTMVANNIPINECIKTIAETLPICQVRGVAYSTFTIAQVANNNHIDIYNYDNPLPFILHNGKIKDVEETQMVMEGKQITKISADLDLFDEIIIMSDGVIHAGIGQTLNFGWELPQVKEFVAGMNNDDYSAKTIATMLVDHCNLLYNKHPGDDTTVACIKIRERKQINLMIGPATNKDDDKSMVSLFMSKEGKHIVCGGTTASIVSKVINEPLNFALEYVDPEIPPTAKLEGIDLVTEGVITLNKVLGYCKNVLKDNSDYFSWCYKQDGASELMRFLVEEATDINFFVGCAINPAHQGKETSINFSIKMQLIEELTKTLKEMKKNVKVSYF